MWKSSRFRWKIQERNNIKLEIDLLVFRIMALRIEKEIRTEIFNKILVVIGSPQNAKVESDFV
jgi:hypothetical protein